MKTFILKPFLLLVLFIMAGSITGLPGLNNTANACSAFSAFDHDVKDKDIIDYLIALGYTNVQILETYENGDRLCSSDYSYLTIVYVEGARIVGAEDIQ